MLMCSLLAMIITCRYGNCMQEDFDADVFLTGHDHNMQVW